MLKFDPNFIQSSRKEVLQLNIAQMHGTKNSEEFCGDAVDLISHRCAGMSSLLPQLPSGPKQRALL